MAPPMPSLVPPHGTLEAPLPPVRGFFMSAFLPRSPIRGFFLQASGGKQDAPSCHGEELHTLGRMSALIAEAAMGD
jgi:hypothetical protein